MSNAPHRQRPCTAAACHQSRAACPCPQACELPAVRCNPLPDPESRHHTRAFTARANRLIDAALVAVVLLCFAAILWTSL